MLILKNPKRIQKSLRNLWADGSWDPSLPEDTVLVSPVDLNLHKKRNLKTEPRKTRAVWQFLLGSPIQTPVSQRSPQTPFPPGPSPPLPVLKPPSHLALPTTAPTPDLLVFNPLPQPLTTKECEPRKPISGFQFLTLPPPSLPRVGSTS